MRGWSIIAVFLLLTCANGLKYDVAVYCATASGVMAAAAAANEGASVILLEPRINVGGMVSGGLGHTDVGNPKVIGGWALQFFQAVGKHYGSSNPVYDFEPHVAEDTFFDILRQYNISVQFNERVASASKSGTVVTSIKMESGLVVEASVFIDASYEGDLIALFGVEYTWGREGETTYNETYAGRLKEPSTFGDHQFKVQVDPYLPNSTAVLNLVYGGDPGVVGQADKKVQAYNYRMCLTNNATNMVPLPTPANYNPANWELFRRYIIALNNTNLSMENFMIVSPLPNKKTDINNNGPISTDFIGGSWTYPDSNWTIRDIVTEAHIQYTLEFFYFLANDPVVPETVRNTVKTWGLAKDEFVNTNNWPHQLYVREARRMLGEYIMTQHDRSTDNSKNDSIGLGSYNIDTHNAQRFPQNGWTVNDGDVEVGFANSFQIPYRSLVPKAAQCTNLISTVCTSASHIGYGPIRLEPQYMIMGQSGGVAAVQAIKEGVAVQNIDIPTLQKRLVELGQYLNNI